MATYNVPELWQKWKLGELSADQALGYLIQNFLTLEQRQTDTEKRVRELEQRLNNKP